MAKSTDTHVSNPVPSSKSIADELKEMEAAQEKINARRKELLGGMETELQVVYVLHAAGEAKNAVLAAATGKGRVHGLKKAGEVLAARVGVKVEDIGSSDFVQNIIAYATELVNQTPASK